MKNHSCLGVRLPEFQGFKNGISGTHNSRTMMYQEMERLMTYCSPDASKDEYIHAIIEDNVLGKTTMSTRRTTATKLAQLYALDPKVLLFLTMRELWYMDNGGRALLLFLLAQARDPILRMSNDIILNIPEGESISKEMLETDIAEASGHRFYTRTLQSTTRNILSSWTQSGHLKGKNEKIRTCAYATPHVVAYALFLGYLCGLRGEMLFDSCWVRLLDLPWIRLDELAFEASRRELLTYRRAGRVVEVQFNSLLTVGEGRGLNGEDQ